MIAINNSRARIPLAARVWPRVPPRRPALARLVFAVVAGCALAAREAPAEGVPAAFVARAENALVEAQLRLHAAPTNSAAVESFARACFDRAEFATNSAERAALADQGISTCRDWVAREPGSAAAHYYLGMNLGQLARTKMLGALRIVDEMEREFKAAQVLDERLDHAGPDRNLGLLYLEAPVIGSVGSRTQARRCLRRAAELAPDYPENRLDLLEAYLKWNERASARTELKGLEALWPRAGTNFTGAAWAPSWIDWNTRLETAREKIGERVESPRGKQ